jgi:hypothetical protein
MSGVGTSANSTPGALMSARRACSGEISSANPALIDSEWPV